MRGRYRLVVASGLLFALYLVPCGIHAQNMFRRGDIDDSGRIDLTDPIRLFQELFVERQTGIRCRDAADADDNGELELTDVVYLFNFLFRGGTPPPAPFPECGVDPTQDTVSCIRRGRCHAEARDRLVDSLFEPLDGREAVVFVLDRSLSMQDAGELRLAKSLITERIRSFSEDYEFAVIIFDRGLIRYPHPPEDGIPVRATPESKRIASEWIADVLGGEGTCPQEALLEALSILRRSTAAGRRIIYFGDGAATCRGFNEQVMMERTLETVGAQNTEGIIIHAAHIGAAHTVQLGFLQSLVDGHGGLVVEIEL